VVREGTGKLARLDGWTAAGKTGSAQKIDPATGRYSPTQLIASFTGFAPLNNPAVTILISLDSPVGLHEGGQVAAPVFKRVAEQVLSYLDVPRDIPVRERILTASRKTPSSNALPDVTDFSPAETSGATDSSAEFAEAASLRATVPQTVALAEGARITVPKLKGKTVREVTEECFRLGLSPVLIGTGVALEQSPNAGQPTRPGGRVTVRFGNAARRNGSGKGD